MLAVTTARGPHWDPDLPIRQQAGWDAHAAFAEDLVERGAIVVGGPIDSEPDEVALLLMDAADEHEVHHLFSTDPWIEDGVLRIKQVRTWQLWLDGRVSAT